MCKCEFYGCFCPMCEITGQITYVSPFILTLGQSNEIGYYFPEPKKKKGKRK